MISYRKKSAISRNAKSILLKNRNKFTVIGSRAACV